MRVILVQRRNRPRARQVVAIAIAQARQAVISRDEGDRIGVRLQPPEQLLGVHVQFVHAVAVRVIVHQAAEFGERIELLVGKPERARGGHGRVRDVVAERRTDRPPPVHAAEVAVHDQAGAGVSSAVDVRLELRMTRQLAGEVVIEPDAGGPGLQRRPERVDVLAHADVEHGEAVARSHRDALHERDLALGAGDQRRSARLRQPQLVQREQSVGIAVEDVVGRHP